MLSGTADCSAEAESLSVLETSGPSVSVALMVGIVDDGSSLKEAELVLLVAESSEFVAEDRLVEGSSVGRYEAVVSVDDVPEGSDKVDAVRVSPD